MQYCYCSPWIGIAFVKVLVLLHPYIFVSNILMKTICHINKTYAVGSMNPWSMSLSSWKRLKTYLWSTMRDDRLFYLMILHVHKQLTDSLNLILVANQFVANNDNRKQMFGTFRKRGMPVKNVFLSNSTQTA